MVACACPPRHGDRAGRHHHRHPVRLGAPKTRRHRALADRQGHRSNLVLELSRLSERGTEKPLARRQPRRRQCRVISGVQFRRTGMTLDPAPTDV